MYAKEAAYYQYFTGIFLWIFELGRVDITVEKPLMDSCMAIPRRGHIEQLFQFFAFIRNKNKTEMVLDPSYTEIDQACFEQED